MIGITVTFNYTVHAFESRSWVTYKVSGIGRGAHTHTHTNPGPSYFSLRCRLTVIFEAATVEEPTTSRFVAALPVIVDHSLWSIIWATYSVVALL